MVGTVEEEGVDMFLGKETAGEEGGGEVTAALEERRGKERVKKREKKKEKKTNLKK